MERKKVEKWAAATAATLRAERGIAGLSQAEVERITGITRSSYRFYEMGKREPNLTQLAKIAEAFGIEPGHLLSEIERRAGGE